MNNYEFKNPKTGRTYKRISKREARKLFDTGNTFIVVPCKWPLFTMWGLECFVDGRMFTKTFDTLINEYTYYNCNNELGRYPAFYVLDM